MGMERSMHNLSAVARHIALASYIFSCDFASSNQIENWSNGFLETLKGVWKAPCLW